MNYIKRIKTTEDIKILKELSRDDDFFIRANVAQNPNTPIEILEKLSEDSENVRIGVAGNPSAPIEIFEKLSEDESLSVKIGIAENPNTPIEILEKWAKIEGSSILKEVVAENPNYKKLYN